MATQKDNLLVSLLKKSVGIPTGASGCCGAPASCACASNTNSEAAHVAAAGPERAAGIARSSSPSNCGCGSPAVPPADADSGMGGCC